MGRLSGRNNGEQREVTLTNDKYCRWSASPRLHGPQPCLVSQKILSIYVDRALARRAGLRDDRPRALLRLSWVGRGVWHPIDLPEGYHTAARGQSQMTHTPVLLRAAPGLPSGRAAPGRRDATHPQRARSPMIPTPLRSMTGKAPDPESDVWAAGRPSTRVRPPDLHQLVHPRLRMTINIVGRARELSSSTDLGLNTVSATQA